MYRTLFIYIIAALLTSSDATVVAGQTSQDEQAKWKLVFSDEFDQKSSTPDTAKWGSRERNNSIWARWIGVSSKNVYVKNGKLVCKAIPNRDNRTDTAAMHTGVVSSQDKFYFQYGKVEVRMRTNGVEGNFPAVWMRPQTEQKPYRYGEIDIVEFFGNEGIARQTVHSHTTNILKRKNIQNEFKANVTQTDWHIYAMEWSKDKITFYIDGKQTGTYAKSTSAKELSDGQWCFDRPFYLILNQSVGKKGWHMPDTSKSYKTEFDWIRVYQKVE